MNAQNYPSYYQKYIERVPEGDLLDLMNWSLNESLKSLVMISEEKGNWAYEEGKWTIKEVLQHIIDTERIYAFRALAFARGEQAEIRGYDHDAYAANCMAEKRTMKSLLEELKRLRSSTVDLFASFTKEMLAKKGIANEQKIQVEQLGFILIGHEMHHVAMIEQKYL